MNEEVDELLNAEPKSIYRSLVRGEMHARLVLATKPGGFFATRECRPPDAFSSESVRVL